MRIPEKTAHEPFFVARRLRRVLRWADDRHFWPGERRAGAVQVGGVNVFPGAVRALLRGHPAVKDVAVRLHDFSGQPRLKAYVVPWPEADPGTLAEHLRQWAAERLPAAARPAHVAVGLALPVNAEGKYAAPAPEVEDGGDAVPEEKMDAIKARLDARDAEVSDLRRRLDEANDPRRLAALVADVVSVREVAARAGVERTDSTDSKALRAAVVEKVLGLRCDGKSADYVTASFDAAVKVLEQRGVGRARATVDGGADALPAGGLIADLHRSAAAHVQKSNHEKGGR
jgi:hypothetical protein